MPNTLLTTQAITERTLAMFQDSLPMLMTGNHDYEEQFTQKTYKRGQAVNIRKPVHYRADDGRVASFQDTNETFETLTIAHQYHTMLEFNTADLSLKINKFQERYIDKVVQELKYRAERDISEAARLTLYHTSGIAGTPINTYQAIANISAKMENLMMPTSMPYLALTPNDTALLKGSLQNSFNDMLNKDISQRGALGHLDQFDMYTSTALKQQTAAAAGGTPLINGTVTSGSTINMDGFPNNVVVFNAGDLFTVAGVNSATPIGRDDTGDLMTFIVTAQVSSNGSGQAVVPVSPAIISDTNNPEQNVTAPLANNAAVTPIASHRVNVAYTRDSLSIVAPPLQKIIGSDSYVAVDKETGASMRFGVQGDVRNDVNAYRVDILMGFKFHPQYAVRAIS